MNNWLLKISSILNFNHHYNHRYILNNIEKIKSRIMSTNRYDHTTTTTINKNLNNHNNNNKIANAIVVCGPSGSGKTTLLNMLFEHFKNELKFSISHTTRKSRPNEINGKSYYFVDRSTFEQMITNKEFVEYSQFSGNYYGTSIQELIANEKSGLLSVLDVDIRGVINLQKNNILKAKYIFIKTPTLQFLESNLRKRGTETDDSISVRLKHAAEDLKQAETLHFDLIIENIVLNDSFEKLRQFVQSELTRFKESQKTKL
ncbi:hypothetical protein DERP_009110 [Dermatophagoides pteronyssinus]|uniref:Uncharacterized protein n=2 Tax=Dermatophagoides pteronyssinus TaxID=6956 RepID=A0ABQ8JQJ9_DERPT|nr:guanylate kinase-like [Dermatophagoides pteronyssinus]KAH9424888.1 hypothetical protein DERP_009110 [Dermatophagoides pteronyssinus]